MINILINELYPVLEDKGPNIKLPIDFKSDLTYESGNFTIDEIKKKKVKVKSKSVGVNNNKNPLF